MDVDVEALNKPHGLRNACRCSSAILAYAGGLEGHMPVLMYFRVWLRSVGGGARILKGFGECVVGACG